MNKNQIKFLEKIIGKNVNRSFTNSVFAICIALIFISISCAFFSALFILCCRLFFSGYDAFLLLINAGLFGKLDLNGLEQISGVLGLAIGGAIGQLIWRLLMIRLGIYSRDELDQE